VDWEWAESPPGRGSSNGIQRLRIEEDQPESLKEFDAVTAIDPGGVTGICTLWYWKEGLLSPSVPVQRCMMAWEASCLYGEENEQTLAALRWISERTTAGMDTTIEDFILQSAIKGRELLSPVRIGHKLDYQFWRGIRVAAGDKRVFKPTWQSANDAKNVVNDNRLKQYAMYTPGPDHARDATRHAILWLRRQRMKIINSND
jgi:hypothetical protein